MAGLENLGQLQKVDLALDALDNQEKTLPEKERQRQLDAEISVLTKTQSDKAKLLSDEESKQKKMEGELDLLSGKIKREQGKLYSGSVTNPKELSGIQQEVKSLGERMDEQETALLEQMDKVERLRTEHSEVADQLAALQAESEANRGIMEATLADIDEKRTVLQEERKPIAEAVPEELLALYGKIRTRHALALTTLKEGICQGCRVELPAEETDRILSSKEIERCPHCGRILEVQ